MKHPSDGLADPSRPGSGGRWRLDDVPVGWIAAAFALLVGLVGAVRVGDRGYWLDEAVTAMFVNRSLGGVLRIVWSQDAGHGPYYLALWAWSHVVSGDGPLRMLSVFGGMAAVGGVVVLAAHWYDRRIAITAGLLLMTNPFFLRYLTELRGYSWTMATSVGYVWALVELVRRPTLRSALWAGCFAGLGLAFHALFGFFLIAGALGVILAKRLTVRIVGWATLAVAVACVIAAPYLHAILTRSDQLDWIPATTARQIEVTGKLVFGGVTVGIPLVVGILASTAIAVRRRALELTVALSVMLLGSGLLVGATFIKPLLVDRYFVPMAPMIALCAAVGFDGLARWIADRSSRPISTGWRHAAAGSIALYSVIVFAATDPLTDTRRYADPRLAVGYVLDNIEPGDLIAIEPQEWGILHYLGDRPDIDPGWAGGIVDSVGYPKRHSIAEIAPELAKADRLFVMVFGDAPQRATREIMAARSVSRVTVGDVIILILE